MYINKFRRNRYIVIWFIPLLLLGTACNGYDQCGYSGGIETTSKVVLQESDSIGSKIDIKNDVSMPDFKNLDISAEKLFANELSVQSLDSYQVVAAQSEVLNKIYEKTLPSIVSIRVFVNNTRRSYGTTLRPQVSEGSGFIWNKDGYIYVMGRVDDVINVAGHRLGTKELESACLTVPEIAEASVVPVVDELKGRLPDIYVSLQPGHEPNQQIQDAVVKVIETTIGKIARPKNVHIVPDMPKTRSGKIMRRILRKIAENDIEHVGDTSTLADPSVVDDLIQNRPSQ